ncbi:hypothetical protein, partial [Rhizobium straminoryzae]
MAPGADAGQDDPIVQLAPLLRGVSRRHDAIAAQITRKILHGQPQIESSLRIQQAKRRGPPKTFTINPSMFAAAIGALTAVARAGASEHDDVQRHFNFLRELVQKVVIAPSADGKSAELTIHGRLAGVLASMQVTCSPD